MPSFHCRKETAALMACGLEIPRRPSSDEKNRSRATPRPVRVMELCSVDFTVRNFLAPLIRSLRDRGCEVDVACSRGPHFGELEGWGFRMVELPMRRSRNPLSHLRAGWALYRRLRRHPVAILHVHTPIAALIGRVAGRLAGIPIIVYTAHGFYFHEHMPPWKRRAHIALEWFGARLHDYLFTQSGEDALTALAAGIEKPGRVRRIGNGVDVRGRFNPETIPQETLAALREQLDLPEGRPVVAMIGRLVREKGYFEFFEALAHIRREIPDVLCLCIGDTVTSEHDDAKQEILARVERLGLRPAVRFTGMRSDIPELLSLCDVYCLPSWREGMPRSIIEAMAMGKPVVATRIRGCREEVVEGETGFLVPVRDPEALAGAVGYLLRHPVIARQLGEAGRRRALFLYDEQRVFERQWQVFRRLLREKLGREIAAPDDSTTAAGKKSLSDELSI